MVECPYCKGKKILRQLISVEWEEPEYKEITCWTCQGKGEITELFNAVYKARGGPTSVQFRGYS